MKRALSRVDALHRDVEHTTFFAVLLEVGHTALHEYTCEYQRMSRASCSIDTAVVTSRGFDERILALLLAEVIRHEQNIQTDPDPSKWYCHSLDVFTYVDLFLLSSERCGGPRIENCQFCRYRL